MLGKFADVIGVLSDLCVGFVYIAAVGFDFLTVRMGNDNIPAVRQTEKLCR